MTHTLTQLTIAEARQLLINKEVSAKEMTQAHLSAIDKLNPKLNAFVALTPDIALTQAEASDERLRKGEARLLEGIPVAVKDLFCTSGVRSAACSHILDGFAPPYESTVTRNLFDAGAVMVGKTNMDEFAMGSANITSYEGPCKNPWRARNDQQRDLVPGGSSGGSAAAVSAEIAMMALGTDTGGSIRQPASFCGIVGMKPTYGRCSRYGIIAFASSLDQAGPMARTVRDTAISLQAIAGHDRFDSTSSAQVVPDFEAALTGDIRGLKVGIPEEYSVSGMDAQIGALWHRGAELLKQAGARVETIHLPHTQYALPTYYILAPAEASSNLARYDGVRYGLRVCDDGDSLNDMYEKTRAAGFGDEVKRRIMIGTYVLSAGYYDAYYKKAQRVRTLIAQDFKSAFEKVDVILTPTAPTAAFGIGDKTDDPLTMYLNDVFTVPSSLAGLPAMSLPAGLNSDGLPLGLQLIGNYFDEETVFRVGDVLEQAVAFESRPSLVAA